MADIEEHRDGAGNVYFMHRGTGQTAWTREELLVSAPLPQHLSSGGAAAVHPDAHQHELQGAWSAGESRQRQKLEQRMRERPRDNAIVIALATLLAAKNNPERAQALIDRAAVAVPNDEHCAVLLRKLAIAHIALWKADRNKPGAPEFINCSDKRRSNLDKAMVLFDQALAHPENSASPIALGEMATTRMHQGQLKPALKEFGAIIQQFPTYDKINTFIFRSAVLLRFHGSFDQALQYFEYLLDDPPTTIGYGELEVLMLVGVGCETANYDGKARRTFHDAEKEWKRLGHEEPAANQDFAKWSLPFRTLADKALHRCDYCLAVLFLEELLSLEPTIVGYIQLGECLALMGEHNRALAAMEAAHEADPDNMHVRRSLIELAPNKWEHKLDEQAAKRQQKEKEERAVAVKQAAIGMKGQHLREQLERKRKLGVLRQWQRNWMLAFAQTHMARVWRGFVGRRAAAAWKIVYLEHEAKVKACVFKVTRHLLHHVLEKWSGEVRWRLQRREEIIAPMIARRRRNTRRRAVQGWVDLHRKERYTRSAVQKAMRGAQDTFGMTPVFYSAELSALAQMADAKPVHEERNRRIKAGESLEGLPPIVIKHKPKPKPPPPNFSHYNLKSEYQPYVSPFPPTKPSSKKEQAENEAPESTRPAFRLPTLPLRRTPDNSRPGSANATGRGSATEGPRSSNAAAAARALTKEGARSGSAPSTSRSSPGLSFFASREKASPSPTPPSSRPSSRPGSAECQRRPNSAELRPGSAEARKGYFTNLNRWRPNSSPAAAPSPTKARKEQYSEEPS